MYHVQFLVRTESTSADEVNSSALCDLLGRQEDVTVHVGTAVDDSDRSPRITGLEVLAAFATSAAAYQLARAVRDFVNRQRVSIEVRTPDGRHLTIKADSGDTASVADLVGFLTNQHTKETRQLDGADKAQKDIEEEEK
jgi:hypothetical protein